MKELTEKLAKLEHEQWVAWSKDLAEKEKLSESRIERWKKYWIPYEQLSEDVKEHDRVWARKVLVALGVLCSKCGSEMVEAGVNLYACPRCSKKAFGMFGVAIPEGKLK